MDVWSPHMRNFLSISQNQTLQLYKTILISTIHWNKLYKNVAENYLRWHVIQEHFSALLMYATELLELKVTRNRFQIDKEGSPPHLRRVFFIHLLGWQIPDYTSGSIFTTKKCAIAYTFWETFFVTTKTKAQLVLLWRCCNVIKSSLSPREV